MKTYVWVTFGFMAWGYYELSGGSGFVPQERVIAAVETEEVEVVTRADTTTLMAVSSSNAVAAPVVAAAVVAPVEIAVAQETAAPEPARDVRSVLGTRVNMRMGPGTGFDVITTLDGGTELEVLDVNADGWANVSVMGTGVMGWMAERLLSDPAT